MMNATPNVPANNPPLNYQDQILAQIPPGSGLRPFIDALGHREAMPLVLQLNDDGELAVVSAEDLAATGNTPQRGSEARSTFLETLADEFNPDFILFALNDADDGIPFTGEEIRTFASIGQLLFGEGNNDPETQMAEAARRVLIDINRGKLTDDFRDSVIAALAGCTAIKLCPFDFDLSTSPDHPLARLMHALLERIPVQDGNAYDFCRQLYASDGPQDDVGFLHAFYKGVHTLVRDFVCFTLMEYINDNYDYSNIFNNNDLPHYTDRILTDFLLDDDTENIFQTFRSLSEAPIDNHEKRKILDYAFKTEFSASDILDLITQEANEQWSFANVIIKNDGLDFSSALLSRPGQKIVSMSTKKNAAEQLLQKFASYKVPGAFEYQPRHKAYFLAETLLRDAVDIHFSASNHEEAKKRAIQDLQSAADALRSIARSTRDEDIKAIAGNAAEMVDDLAMARMQFADIKKHQQPAELAPYIFGTTVQPGTNRHVRVLAKEAPEEIAETQGFGALKTLLADLSVIEDNIPKPFDENGGITDDDAFSWRMIDDALTSIETDLGTAIGNGLLSIDGFVFSQRLNILLAGETSALAEMLREATGLINLIAAGIMDITEDFVTDSHEASTAILEQARTAERAIRTFKLSVDECSAFWGNEKFLNALDGGTKEIMIDFSEKLMALNALVQDPDGPIAGLLYMIRAAAENPRLFAARLNAAHEI